MSIKIYVGNLAWSTTADDLHALFSACGDVINVQVSCDRDTGRSRGFAFVEMSEAGAENALTALNGSILDGRVLSVRAHGSLQARIDHDPSSGGNGCGNAVSYGGGGMRHGGQDIAGTHSEPMFQFTAAELQEMIESQITLDDAITAIEKLRTYE